MAENLRLKDLVIGYENQVISSPINLEVPAGRALAVLGPSGCGKSTLLNTVVGGQAAISGGIFLGGRKLNEVPIAKRRIAIMYQAPMLFPHLSVGENISFGMDHRILTKKQIAEKVQEYLALVKLAEFEKRNPNELSGGQAQRVALARTLAASPECLLLDEPLSALDSDLRSELARELRDLIKERELTTIFVTHDRSEAELIADDVIDWNWGWK